MAELEATTVIDAPQGSADVRPSQAGTAQPRVLGWKQTLPVGKLLRLGRIPGEADWTVDDPMVSAFHATLEWDGAVLVVKEREPVGPYSKAPANPIWFKEQKVKRCDVRPRDTFVIGQTRFTLVPDGDSGQAAAVDGTVLQHAQNLSRAELEGLPFTNPAAALRAMEQVPNVLRLATNEQTLFRQMLKVVLDALPRADAAGVVAVPPDLAPGEIKVNVLDYHARGVVAQNAAGFIPSRRLTHKAVKDKKSCLHLWSPIPADQPPPDTVGGTEMTLGGPVQLNTTPWAICTPFQDGSRYTLYLSGRLSGNRVAQDPAAIRDLTEYQKVAEVLVGLLETTRRTHRLARQNALIKQSWPRGTWKYLDDPDKLEQLLRPREMDVTVLFCDLRGSSLFAEQGADALVRAWKGVAGALDDMSGAITANDGVVAGFQGDAVMGFWGWPEAQEGQVEKALKAASRIQQVFSGWLAELKCGLGLAHGRAVAGRLGASDLAKVDVYGPVVNLASRLETMTKSFGVSVVVNAEVADRVAAADPYGNRYRTRKLGTVRPKGMQKTFPISELLPADSDRATDQIIEPWNRAVDQFTAGEWEDAYRSLEDWFSEDKASWCLRRVMDKYNRVPPPNWDGAFTPPAPEE